MTDYGHDLRFGLFPSPEARELARLLDLVQLAEATALDLVSIQDHPYQAAHLDTWTLLSFLAGRTHSVTLAPNVASLPLRDPVILAKSTASLSLLTDGRVELGLGAGAFWDAIAAAGGPRRTPGEAVRALTEAIELVRAFWAGSRVDHDGTFYRTRGLRAGPVPAVDIPIWLGAYKPRMLALTGRLADAWVPSMGYADPPALPDLNARIDEAALAAGRDPAAIVRIYNVFGAFGTGSGFLRGRPADWAEQLAGLAVDQGMSTFILGTDDPRTIGVFAQEVAPAVRELVASERDARAAVTSAAVTNAAVTSAGVTSAGVSSAGVSSAGVSNDGASTGVTSAATPGASADGSAEPAPRPASVTQPIAATPDDGTRLTGDLAWDETRRPRRGESDYTGYTAAQLAHPRHLIEIHDGLRGELERVRDIVRQVRAGHLDVGQARSIINTMAMRQNNWTLGAFCESYCRIVTGHHTLEDRGVFPHLRRSEPGLAPVLDRLEAEHEVIAEVIDGLDRALVALVTGDGVGRSGAQLLDDLEAQVDLLTDTLVSHLAYEEAELIGPLARHGLN